MTARRVAVLDQGSTATKGGVYTLDGACLASTTQPVERHTDDRHVHHDAERIAADVECILSRLLADHDVEAIGIASQRSTCLVWERASGRALTPALSWQDRSQSERVADLEPHAERIRRVTGLRLSPFYAAPKLAALLEGLPDGTARAAAGEIVAGTLDAFLVHRLTGEPATEPGIAGRTLLYDLAEDRWDASLCELFGVPRAALPVLRASVGRYGTFCGVPVAAVAGDQQAALLGHGGWRGGTTIAHFGTGAFVLAATGDRLRRHEGLLSAVVASTGEQRRFQIEGSVNSAGSAVDWARRLAGENLEDWADRPLSSEPPLVLPAFAGVAAPWWHERATATVTGLGPANSAADLLEGVLSGVAHRVVDCVEAIREAGVPLETLRVSGKLTRLRGLVQRVADAGQVVVEVAPEEEAGSLGLVRLLGATLDGSDRPLRAAPPTGRRVAPRWSADRTRAARRRWLDFVRKALAMSS